MIEILILMLMYQNYADKAVFKGHPAWKGGVPPVVGWVGGEILGLIVGVSTSSSSDTGAAYGLAIVGAIIGAIIGSAIAGNLPAQPGSMAQLVMSGSAVAAYCSQCRGSVWVDAKGKCPKKHGSRYLSNAYVADPSAVPAQGVAPAATPVHPVAPAAVPAPAQAVAAPAQAVAAPAQQRWAGFCSECGQNIWLAQDGCCPNGHAASSVVNTYLA